MGVWNAIKKAANSTVGRVVTGVATGGLSEVARGVTGNTGNAKWDNSTGVRIGSALVTGGGSEMSRLIGGKANAFKQLGTFAKSLDPTVVQKADTSGVTAGIDALKGQSATLGAALAARGQRAAPQMAANLGQIAAPTPIQAAQMQAAQMQSANPMQVANMGGPAVVGNAATQAAMQQEQGGIGMLQDAAMGNAPSAAQMQLQRGLEQAQRQQMGAVNAGGGYNPLAMRAALQNGSAMSADANQQSAILRAQEMAQGRGAYADALSRARGMTLGEATTDAGFRQDTQKVNAGFQQDAFGRDNSNQQQTNLTNAGFVQGANQVNTGAQNDINKFNADGTLKASMFNGGQALSVGTANQSSVNTSNGQNDQYDLGIKGLQNNLDTAGLNAQVGMLTGEQNRQGQISGAKGQVLGAILGGAGAMAGGAMKSDRNEKHDIKDGAAKTQSFLDALSAHTYKYDEPQSEGAGPGERLGIMAQDVEKVLPSAVKDTPGGKQLDIGASLGAVLAAQAELNKRLKKMEGKKNA